MIKKNENFMFKLIDKLPFFLKNFLANSYTFYKKRFSKYPKNYIFFVTNHCNARCSHCFYWRDINTSTDDLTIGEIEKIADSFHPFSTITLTGGEPFLRKDLVDICVAFSKKCNKINIPTNGIATNLITSYVSEILDKSKLKELNIQVSLDGFGKLHDDIRGVNCFDKVISTINELKKLDYDNLNITVLTTLTKRNITDYLNIIKLNSLLRELDVHHGFHIVRGTNFSINNLDKSMINSFDSRDALPSKEELLKFKKRFLSKNNDLLSKIDNLVFDYSLKILFDHEKALDCMASFADCVLFVNGDVSVCEFMKPFDNLKNFDYDFKKLWRSDKLVNLRKLIKNCSCSHSCNLMTSIPYNKDSLLLLMNNGGVKK